MATLVPSGGIGSPSFSTATFGYGMKDVEVSDSPGRSGFWRIWLSEIQEAANAERDKAKQLETAKETKNATQKKATQKKIVANNKKPHSDQQNEPGIEPARARPIAAAVRPTLVIARDVFDATPYISSVTNFLSAITNEAVRTSYQKRLQANKQELEDDAVLALLLAAW